MTRLAHCLFAIGLLAIGLLAAGAHVRAQQQQVKVYSAIEQQLSRGITLYATDDDSNEAEALFRKVMAARSSRTKEGETALYYLGRYYHRNFYMLRQPALLDRAIDRYKDLHLPVDRLKTASTWYAEARFYKGLAYLQQGKWKDAYEAVDHIDPKLDASAEIDYLVWSYNKRQVNRRVPTQVLKDEYLRVLNAQGVKTRREGAADSHVFEAIVRELESSLNRKALTRAN